ncbi:11185_t:CDS:2 [Acaulospora morrowiae]|uniref:11185_t:CDS:1 n=1 Tax=Acaulospora morrowiae TaxID=94023 RepID=A0A9N9GNX8_9GLOM|nr:11185_t:CDS:2 [Acaulospora morrowiae]
MARVEEEPIFGENYDERPSRAATPTHEDNIQRMPAQVTNPRDANLCEVEGSEDEAYAVTRSRHQPYTFGRPRKLGLRKEPTEKTASQPRQDARLQPERQEERTQTTRPVEMEITEESAKEKPKSVTPRIKRQRGPSVVDQAPLYNVAEDLLNQRANATYAQLLQIPKQRQNLAQALKRPIVPPAEVGYVDNQPQRISAARCNVKIRKIPVVAVLDSGAAVSIMSKKLLTKLGLRITEPSSAVVVTANGTRERTLGKIRDVALELGGIIIPTDFQVIESTDEMMLLGMSWFKKLRARLHFDEQKLFITYDGEIIDCEEDDYFDNYEKEELDEVESYLTDDQKDLYTNPWTDEYSPAVYLTTIEEIPTPEETERQTPSLEDAVEELATTEVISGDQRDQAIQNAELRGSDEQEEDEKRKFN